MKKHLEDGYCWATDIDGEPRCWAIIGHHAAEADDIVTHYEGEIVMVEAVERYARMVPCHRPGCDCDGTSHMETADGPGRGAFRITDCAEKAE